MYNDDKYVFTKPILPRQDITQGHFFSEVDMIWTKNFSFSIVIVLPLQRNLFFSTIYQ